MGRRSRPEALAEDHLWGAFLQRDTVYSYDAGTLVYRLTAPNGDVYTMQSYSQIKDKSLTIGDLDNLSSKLSLPQGWKYNVHTLSQQMRV